MAEEHARRGVALMEATFGQKNPRTATAYGTLAAILKCEPRAGTCMRWSSAWCNVIC